MTPAPDAPKTLRDHARNFSGALVIVLVTLLLLEGLVRLIDPWGLHYFADLEKLGNTIFRPHAQRGYFMPDGDYAFTRWQASVREGGRVVPDTAAAAACTIGVLGDSVAFGYGVNDADTWLNVIARQIPDVTIRNWAVPRYNSTNVVGTWRTFPNADAYLYLMIQNDLDPAVDVATQRFVGAGEGMPWLVRYGNFAVFRAGGTDRVETGADVVGGPFGSDQPGLERFLSEIDILRADERVTFAGFRNENVAATLRVRGLAVVEWVYPANRRISLADYHLNPAGNAALAAQALPTFQALARECGEK